MNHSRLLIRLLGSRVRSGKHFVQCTVNTSLRTICTKNDDFKWMDDATENLKVHDASTGLMKLTKEQWAEFERNGFIEDMEDVEIVEDEDDEEIIDISEELLLEFMQLEGEDIMDIIDDSSDEGGEIMDVSPELVDELTNLDNSHTDTILSKRPEATQAEDENIHPWEYDDEATEDCNSLPENLDRRSVRTESFGSLPIQAKKPGMETRIRRQQNEMWNIVHNILTTEFTQWDKSGANIVQVVLSPDLRNLSIVYDAPPEVISDKSWGRLLKQATRSIRVELSKRHAKYAPKVHFQCGSQSEKQQLDDIFDQIALERQVN